MKYSKKIVIYAFCGLGFAAAVTFTARPAQAANIKATAKSSTKSPITVTVPLDGVGTAVHETNAGDFVADALRETSHADAALVPADELTEVNVPAGGADTETLLDALRYDDDPSDTVVVLNLTGAQILKAAERSVSRTPQPFQGFLQVSGMQVRYNPGQPAGKRVSSVSVQYSDVHPAKVYRVATTRALANGALGYFKVWAKTDIVEDTGVTLRQSLTSYLVSHKTISTAVEGRIGAITSPPR